LQNLKTNLGNNIIHPKSEDHASLYEHLAKALNVELIKVYSLKALLNSELRFPGYLQQLFSNEVNRI